MSQAPAYSDLDVLSDKLDLVLSRGTERWPNFMTLEIAHAYSSLSIKALRRLIDRGVLVPCRPTGRILLARAEIDDVILSSRKVR